MDSSTTLNQSPPDTAEAKDEAEAEEQATVQQHAEHEVSK